MNTKSLSICFVTPSYPTPQESVFTFVEQLVNEIAIQGNHCSVIAPQSITKVILGQRRLQPKYQKLEVSQGVFVDLYRPLKLSFSTVKFAGRMLSTIYEAKTINHALHNLKKKPDVVYGHFWNSAYASYDYAKKNQLPLFVASGEAEVFEDEIDEMQRKRPLVFDYLSGAIAVSTKCKEESMKWGFVDEKRVEVFPNSINSNRFYKKDKKTCRKALGIQDDEFLIAFIGRFEHRKGTLRVNEAIKRLNNPKIKSFFVGEDGDEKPDCKGVIFYGKMMHDKLVDYLNAADIYVLPTLNEGCCNAIIEAMACGLPIVSSNLSFNDDVLTPENSIRIDPMNIDEISKAIDLLYHDSQLRESMSNAALQTAKELTIDKRAARIIDFIHRKINK